MGRSESVVWRYFDQVNANASKYKKIRCKFCTPEYTSNAQRMLNHLIFKCNECPESVENFLNSEPISQNDTSNTNTSTNVIDDLTPKTSTQMYVFKGIDKEKKIDHFFDKVTPQEQKDLEAAFARALIATNLPLSVFDNYYWKSFFTSLRPAFKKPSRYVISHRLLNAEYEKVNKAVEDKINNADTLTIMSDGWTDVNGDGVTNIVITTPEPIFYKAIESKEEAHTAKYPGKKLDDRQ